MLTFEAHPTLFAPAFITEFTAPLGELASPDWLIALHAATAVAPLTRTEELRTAVRDLLRHGGYKPTGRGKPSSEYLQRTATDAALPRINLAVDACNAVSLHSGLPISVIDLSRAHEPLRVAIASAGTDYVFNASGQTIDVEGLVCLFDADGPCANAVKDAQRTKTSPATRSTLSIVWGVRVFEAHTRSAVSWYRELLERAGARTRDVA